MVLTAVLGVWGRGAVALGIQRILCDLSLFWYITMVIHCRSVESIIS